MFFVLAHPSHLEKKDIKWIAVLLKTVS